MPLPPLVEPGPPLTPEQVARFSRHILLPEIGELGQRRLLNARVCVIGAGGLGSPALLYLAAAGVGTLGLVDDDVVEVSNLQRQIAHGELDVGRFKIASAAESVSAISADAVTRLHRVRLDESNVRDVLRDYDLVIDGTDNFATRYLVADACADLGLPLIWAAILRFDAQLSVFWQNPPVGEGVGLRDLFAEPPTHDVDTCSTAGVLGALCGQVGSTMAAEAVKLIVGAGEPLLGRVLVLDALTARWREVPLKRREGSAAGRVGASTPADDASARPLAGANALSAPVSIMPPAPSRGPAGIGLVSVATLAQRLAARDDKRDDFVLLDVREPDEVAKGAIPGALHVPLAEALTEIGRQRVGDPREVIVYCHVGPRATMAARSLLAHGFENVHVLHGGMEAWSA